MEIALIAAVAANGVIGRDGGIPWHLPEDLRRFKRLTTGHPVIMGRRTYESILDRLGEPLPDRTTVVLSTTLAAGDLPDDVSVVRTPAEAVETARRRGRRRAFVAGGEQVYSTFLPVADRLFLTELEADYEGDTHFPEWDRSEWRTVERDRRDGYAFVEYERIGDPTATL